MMDLGENVSDGVFFRSCGKQQYNVFRTEYGYIDYEIKRSRCRHMQTYAGKWVMDDDLWGVSRYTGASYTGARYTGARLRGQRSEVKIVSCV